MSTSEQTNHSLLKFITCGSVDDGKSTLIGHMLYDSKLLYADQIRALELESKVGSRGGKIDYSLLLDGLVAEREQGITIDVAYRYFTTDHRSFIVADTPGHEEYTRNMAVGASFADLAIILIDATKGVLAQTRRHARICSLMGIRYFVFAINKMDLAGFDENRFNEISSEIRELQKSLALHSVELIPISATEGDNVTHHSDRMIWYKGPALLTYLENVVIGEELKSSETFYLPVQRVCRPDYTFRGFQGQIEEGSVAIGDELTSLPSGEKGRVKRILVGNKDVEQAFRGQPVNIQLDRELDVSRGCVLAKGDSIKAIDSVEASVLWMDDTPLRENSDFFVKLGTKLIPGTVHTIDYTVDVNTGEHKKATELSKNGIASCRISFADRVVADSFKNHKTLGEFILIDRVTNMTSGCGVIDEVFFDGTTTHTSDDLRRSIVRYEAKAFSFDPKVAGFDLPFLKKVERELLSTGHLVIVIDGGVNEARQAIPFLIEAGVSVLVLGVGINNTVDITSLVKNAELDSVVNAINKNLL